MKKIVILLFLILNFFGSENLNSDSIQPTEENVKLFNSYFENPKIIESRNFIKNSFQNWSNDYFGDIKNILKYGEEEQISKDQNTYTKKKALIDLDFIKDTIEENHGARLVLDKWFFDQLDRLIEIAKNKILNSKNEDERLHIIDECIEPLEDKISKNIGGHFYIKINCFNKKYNKNDIEKKIYEKNYYYLDKYNLKIYENESKNLYLRISSMLNHSNLTYEIINFKNEVKNRKNRLSKYLIIDLRDNKGGHISKFILDTLFGRNNKYNRTIIHNYNNNEGNFNIMMDMPYKKEQKRKNLAKNYVILINKMTYSDSLNFIDGFKNLVNKENLILIGNDTVKNSIYGGEYLEKILPSQKGKIFIPINFYRSNAAKDILDSHNVNFYRNYDHIDNPDDLIDQVVADVEAYKKGFKFSDKENAHKFKKDLFEQPIDDDKFVIPNKKYYPKLETTEFGYDIYKDIDGAPIYNDYLF